MEEEKKSVAALPRESAARHPQMARATVERGRTVVVPHPTKRITAKYTEEGKPVIVPVLQHFGPGDEVELPFEEVVLFRKLGYLVDPNRKIPARAGENPNVHQHPA
jgi:hypothetical protein